MSCFKYLLFIIVTIFTIYNIYINKKREQIIQELKSSIKSFYEEVSILKQDYITYSSYETLKNKYNNLYNKTILYQDDYLNKFNKIYKSLKENVDILNEKYIEKELEKNKEYFDKMFNYPLALDQRKAIITDDNYNLIIAGAGSGKTSTLLGKVNYLIEKKKINPNEIIVISFTNKTVSEFNKKLKYKDVRCTTFHQLRKGILNKAPSDDALLNTIIERYLCEEIINSEKELKEMVDFFALYRYVPYDISKNTDSEIFTLERNIDFETLNSKVLRMQLKDKNDPLITLNKEFVRSREELVIANFLFMNGIDYKYEKVYKYKIGDISSKPDFYLPKYDIYIEHFGINKKLECAPNINTEKYLKEMELKRETHQKYNTKLIETYSYYYKDGVLFKKLKEKLLEYNVEFNKKDYKEIYKAILENSKLKELEYFRKLIARFIVLFKGNNYKLNKFDEFMNTAINDRDRILLKILRNIYCKYEEELIKEEKIDFNDMINLTTETIKKEGFPNKVSYIIVDEFQDVSYPKYILLKSIIEKTTAKLIAAGDDWQSIYRFTGCDLKLFIDFTKYFPNAKELIINDIYRNSQELIEVSKKIISKNKNQKTKTGLISKKRLTHPIHIHYYVNNNIIKALNIAIDDLKSIGCKNIAIIGRNRNDLNELLTPFGINISNTNNYVELEKYFHYPIYFCTIHESKGLEFDGVILCNLRDDLNGFPNKMLDDPILKYVSLATDDLFEEERRLFYVSLTRTKTRTCLLVPDDKNASIFVDELKKTSGQYIKEFETNEKSNSIKRICPKCQNGKLIIKNGKNGCFISCTNYPICNYSENLNYYY